ncbi:DUF983 domain-containing protein [Brevundimonas terrae]|uniref:DUF983 domain-containing protein n=1 Tax=Brevundimonas terrae TaxID=363631 RepID=A0ABP3I1H2_9CAUL|nr:DUF983 domain-containing protein [Brevundimonas terrae]NIJ25434.1 uncharacterized protein (DUF983 family) [Brevundimonas terrae]
MDNNQKLRGPKLRGREAVWAGVRGRCPECGQGALFAGWLKVSETCEACGFALGKVETGDGAATFIMQITGITVGMSAVAFNLAYRPPLWVNLVFWLPLVIVVAVGLMRPGKGLMTALNLLRCRADD